MKKQKLANVSPWLLAAACTLLAVIISVFAVSNYRREKELMSKALLQQGLTISRFVTSSSRASLRGNPNAVGASTWQWTDHVQQAIDHSADHPGLRFMGLIDPEGVILAGTESEQNNTKIDQSTFQFLQNFNHNGGPDGSYAYRKWNTETDSVFQVATLYQPFGFGNPALHRQGRGPMSRMRSDGMRALREMEDRKLFDQIQDLRSKRFVLLMELDLDEFNQAVRRQLLQIVSLSLVLLLVGIGGWLSLLTLQGLKGSQSRLRQIRQFTDILVSSLPVGLIAVGHDGTIRIFNKAAEQMVGIAAAEVLGNEPEKVLPVSLSTELKQKQLPAGGGKQKEIIIRDEQARARSLMTIALPVVDSNNRYAGNTLLLQDVSQIKDLQRELRKNERLAALGKMAAGVAHELRNPLSSIKGLALLLKAKVQNDRQGNGTADILVQEVERLNRSIGELLDYARPHKLQLEKIDIGEVLDKAVALIAADVDSAGIALQGKYTAGLYVHGDRDKLIQVFLNLMLNSIQAMDNGGTLKITVDREDGFVGCLVEDTGCGLDEEGVAKVFDPYFTTKSGGTGLGLAMSAKIIEEHSGTIEFRSAVGAGTAVKVSLPVYLEES
jgi:two-component system sensor histidine kinase HydH